MPARSATKAEAKDEHGGGGTLLRPLTDRAKHKVRHGANGAGSRWAGCATCLVAGEDKTRELRESLAALEQGHVSLAFDPFLQSSERGVVAALCCASQRARDKSCVALQRSDQFSMEPNQPEGAVR